MRCCWRPTPARAWRSRSTAGEASTHGRPQQRASERDRASALLGLARRITLDLPDTALGTDGSHRAAVVALLRELRPRVLLAPYPSDRHPDHAAAGRLARERVFWPGCAASAAAASRTFRNGCIPHAARGLEPTFVVDVGAVWERRCAALEAYASQFGRAPQEHATRIRAPFLDMLDARAVVHGALVVPPEARRFAWARCSSAACRLTMALVRPAGVPKHLLGTDAPCPTSGYVHTATGEKREWELG